MRFVVIALAAGLALAATSASADDLMASTYANTVKATDAKGVTSSFLFNADGTYTINATGPDGKPVTIPGKWTTKDGGATLCLQPASPPNTPPPAPSCSPLSAHKIGDTWTVVNDMKETFTVTLVAGR
jgi:hypothetical protein